MLTGQKAVVVIVLFLALNVGTACKCQLQKPAATYCLSHWTARTVIEDVQGNATNPAFGGVDESDIRYKVRHIEIFKTPKELDGALPIDIYTPEDESACGLALQKGQEYLLSGRYINKTLISMLCGQILYENPLKSRFDDILLWSEVPIGIYQKLQAHEYDAKCI